MAAVFTRSQRWEPIPGIRAAILPHHLTARALIADLVQQLPKTEPATIVLLGPDHQNAGSTFFTSTASDWESGGLHYSIDHALTERLHEQGIALPNDEVIRQEHSVLIPMAFLARQYPQSRFVLLAVRGGFDQAAIQALATELHQKLGQNDLVIASVDFSHYQSLAQAEEEDRQSLRMLEAGNADVLQTIPADSPASLAVTMRFAQLRGASKLTILQHQNSAQILGDPALQSTTSYFTAVFSPQ